MESNYFNDIVKIEDLDLDNLDKIENLILIIL